MTMSHVFLLPYTPDDLPVYRTCRCIGLPVYRTTGV